MGQCSSQNEIAILNNGRKTDSPLALWSIQNIIKLLPILDLPISQPGYIELDAYCLVQVMLVHH
jgi:hypothetical protein